MKIIIKVIGYIYGNSIAIVWLHKDTYEIKAGKG